jgi:hypothetical protein
MILFSLLCAVFARTHRVLVVLNSNATFSAHSLFFSDLTSLGCTLTTTICNSTVIQLERFGERLYDTVVVLCGSPACFGAGTEALIRFLDNGGNAYLFASTQVSDIQSHLYRHFSLHVAATSSIADLAGSTRVILRNFLAPPAIVSRQPPPLVYAGGFALIDRPNDFRIPIVSGGIEHTVLTMERMAKNPSYAYDLIPIYALQSRTGGRVVVVHSREFATDNFFNLSDVLENNGNRQLLRELSEYVTHFKSHARLVSATHFATETGLTPVQYHVKQNVTVVAQLESVVEGEWVEDQGDLQVEVFMVGTFIRRHMKKLGKGKFEEVIRLPDRAGNFKIKVFTDREGWMNAREEMAIAIRPLAIREKEKFLDCARPYQISVIIVMAAAFLVSIHVLYHKPTD